MTNNRILTNELLDEDNISNIRPETLDDYIGQSEVKENIRVFIKSAIMREYENLMQDIPLKENVKEILTKLKSEGNTIIFITARSKQSYNDPYLISKTYLDKRGIPYDKIIVNAWEKGTICKEEKIDLFIDDNIRNCTDASKQGIEVLMMDACYNLLDKEFTHMNNWKQVYEYINQR